LQETPKIQLNKSIVYFSCNLATRFGLTDQYHFDGEYKNVHRVK